MWYGQWTTKQQMWTQKINKDEIHEKPEHYQRVFWF
jgi:hypothetical protein